ncbi:MAG: acetyl-CoA C-acyltransferase, partial [Kangiellaceae bacterium]|nr:acetyl-CoA C-acyltransferase [Kangiellaceae bacterium]
AVESHKKAAAAWQNGAFNKSVVPVLDRNGMVILDRDEMVRPDCSMETLSTLKPSFLQMGQMGFDGVAKVKYPQVESINHIHSPGNSSAIVDGAAAVLLGNEDTAKQFNLTPRARVVATALVGTDPTIMLTGPAPATEKALKIAGLTVDDIDLFEVNEAFASVVMRFQSALNVPWEKINVNGGAIAMGHPLGATGAMILGTLLDELEARNLKRGLATLCIGGGMGIATIIERV